MRPRCLPLIAILAAAALGLPAQGSEDGAVLGALERWTRAFLAGKVDVSDPKPIDPDAPVRLPPGLLPRKARVTELQVLELLVQRAAEVGTSAAAEGVLRLAAIGLDPKHGNVPGAVIVRGVAEDALDNSATPAMHACMLDFARRPASTAADIALRLAAVRALGGSGQAVFWPTLAGLLRDGEARMRAAAARALGDLGNPRAIPHLVQALGESTSDADAQAITLALRDLLALAQRAGELDPLSQQDAIRAVAAALERCRDWRVGMDLIRFLERHRAREAVPALIAMLARAQDGGKGRGDEPRGARFLREEAHRVLKAMTGAVLGADDVAAWRGLWESAQDSLQVVPFRRADLVEGATVAGGFFGIPVLGTRVVFVIDVSGSMVAPAPQQGDTSAGDAGVPSRLDIARRECWNAVQDMAPDTYFNLVVFSDRARTWRADLVAATAANKGAARNFLARLAADGSTNLWDALSTAMRMRTVIGESRYREPIDEIFVLSDGHPSSGEITDAATILARIAEQNRHAGIKINAVFIGSTASDLDRLAQPGGGALMQVLAEQNGGSFVAR